MTMQLGLCLLLAVFLGWVELMENNGGNGGNGGGSSSIRAPKGKRQRRISAETSQGCAKGCLLCSAFNGCLKCSPKLFILLERSDIRQTGVCLPSCPRGYFGLRHPEMNKCIKCKLENCEDCFSRNFCTKCKEGLHLYKGRCYDSCPDGISAANSTVECSSPAQCEMSEWGPWGPCSKRRRQCGFRKGNEERARTVLQVLSGEAPACPATTESRRCTVQRHPCPEGRKKKKKGEQGKRGPTKSGQKEAKEDRPGRRKGQPRGTDLPAASPL